jgi:hypothetical protein
MRDIENEMVYFISTIKYQDFKIFIYFRRTLEKNGLHFSPDISKKWTSHLPSSKAIDNFIDLSMNCLTTLSSFHELKLKKPIARNVLT